MLLGDLVLAQALIAPVEGSSLPKDQKETATVSFAECPCCNTRKQIHPECPNLFGTWDSSLYLYFPPLKTQCGGRSVTVH